MPDSSNYLLVDASVLPDVFLKVVRAKQLFAQGKAKNLSEATKLADISRSSFYKYKDCVFSYQADMAGQIVTLYAELEDRPGVLSTLLSSLYSAGANILTINQNIPVDSVAPVSVSMRTDGLQSDLETLLQAVRGQDGIVHVRYISS